MVTLWAASILCSVAIVGCSRIHEPDLIGTWRHEDDDGIGEITLGADHSYRSIQSFKREFTTPSVIEGTGSWRLSGKRLDVDSTVTWSKEPSKMTFQLIDVTADTLRMKDTDETKEVVFARFHPTECALSSSSAVESDVHGTWDFHYHTHDYRYSFAREGSVTLSGLISGEWTLVRTGEWKLSDGILTIREKAVRGSPDEQEVTFQHSGIRSLEFT